MPISPSSSLHTLFYNPASFLPWLLLSPPRPPHTPHFCTGYQHKPQNCLCPKSSAPAGTPAATIVSALSVCFCSQVLQSPAHLSSHVFTFPKLLLLVLTPAARPPRPHARPICSLAGLRLMSGLLFTKQELCFCQALSKTLYQRPLFLLCISHMLFFPCIRHKFSDPVLSLPPHYTILLALYSQFFSCL